MTDARSEVRVIAACLPAYMQGRECADVLLHTCVQSRP